MRSTVLHSHTVLMKVCLCGRYRQLNSVLYPNNRIPKSSKTIFHGLVLNYLSAFSNLKVGNPKLLCFFLQNTTQIPSLEPLLIIYVC